MAGRLEQRPLDESHRVPSAKEQVETVPGVQKKSRFTVQEFEAPYYKSIRFRLTAWYAAALILVIVALSVSLHTLLVRALSNDAQSRLGNAVLELEPNITVGPSVTGRQGPSGAQYIKVNQQTFD